MRANFLNRWAEPLCSFARQSLRFLRIIYCIHTVFTAKLPITLKQLPLTTLEPNDSVRDRFNATRALNILHYINWNDFNWSTLLHLYRLVSIQVTSVRREDEETKRVVVFHFNKTSQLRERAAYWTCAAASGETFMKCHNSVLIAYLNIIQACNYEINIRTNELGVAFFRFRTITLVFIFTTILTVNYDRALRTDGKRSRAILENKWETIASQLMVSTTSTPLEYQSTSCERLLQRRRKTPTRFIACMTHIPFGVLQSRRR